MTDTHYQDFQRALYKASEALDDALSELGRSDLDPYSVRYLDLAVPIREARRLTNSVVYVT